MKKMLLLGVLFVYSAQSAVVSPSEEVPSSIQVWKKRFGTFLRASFWAGLSLHLGGQAGEGAKGLAGKVLEKASELTGIRELSSKEVIDNGKGIADKALLTALGLTLYFMYENYVLESDATPNDEDYADAALMRDGAAK